MTDWTRRLVAMGACANAVAWAKTQPDLKTAWATCERGDWMLWLAGRRIGTAGSAAHRSVVRAACACAREALPIYEARHPGDTRPRVAIEAGEAWAKRPSKARLKSAADAAAAAADAADAVRVRQATLAACAVIVRGIIPKPPVLPTRTRRTR